MNRMNAIADDEHTMIQFVDTPYAVTYSASGEAYVQWPGGSTVLSLVGYAQVSVEVAGTANTRSFDVLMGKISGATLASRVAADQPVDGKIHTYPVVGPEMGLVLRGTPNTTDHVQLWVYLHSRGLFEATAADCGETFHLVVAPVGDGNPRNSEAAIVPLNNGCLLLGWTEFYAGDGADHGPARISGKVSSDRGRTWGEKYTLVENDAGCNVIVVNFLRAKDGRLMLFYCQKNSKNSDCRVMMRVSADEGKTWGTANQISPDNKYTGLANGRSIRLASGRILLEAWEGGNSYCYLSDDDGATWRESQRVNPGKGSWEPACVELKNGGVLMLTRTGLGGQYKSVSKDGGETWSSPVETQLTGTAAPASVSRIPTTGDLLAIWNHDSGASTRNPLTSAISNDEGETWEHFRNIEDAPNDAWAYPAVTWVEGNALLTYHNSRGGVSLQLKNIPAQRFYPCPRTIEDKHAMWIQFVDTPYAVTYSASGEAFVQWPGGSNVLSLVGYAQVSVEVAGTANTRSFDVLMGKISGATLASRVAADQPADMKIHTYPVVGPEIALVLRGTPNTTDHVQLWVYLGQAAALGGPVSVPVDSTPGSTAFVSVTDFGATGDGVTDDSAAIQAAIDTSDSVFFPLPPVHYRLAHALQLRNDLTLWAQAMWRGVRQGSTGSFLLVADAGTPAFKTGVYPGGSGGQNRNISLLGLSARSSGAAVLELHTATNFTVERCSFASYAFADATRGAVDIRFSYRGTIRRSNIGASGGAWAISAFDNCNGLVVESSIISGGNGGGAFDLGQSQSVAFRNNVMEVSKAGVRVGSTAVAGGGNCNGLDVSGNYFEQVREPISLGVGFTVRAATVQNNFISNTALVGDVSPYTFELGRCEACTISNNEINRASMGTEPLFSFVSAASAPFSFVGGSIVSNRYTGGTGPWKSESGPFTPLASFLFGKNRLQPAIDGPISGSRQYESLAISAASGTTIHAIASATTGGGVIDSIEVFDKNGSSDSTVQLGSALNISEIVSFDPQTLTYSYGAASVAPSGVYRRPNYDLLLRVLPSSGTGTYRLRVRFRGM